LALACDPRIASRSASIKMAFLGMGFAPDAGSSYFLSRMIGTARAMDLSLTGRTVNAEEAESMGVASAVTEPEKLDAAVHDLAMKLVESSSKALAFTKRLVNKPLTSLSEAMENEATLQDIVGHNKDHVEAVKAFLEKRRPKLHEIESVVYLNYCKAERRAVNGKSARTERLFSSKVLSILS
jgi:2-(1,2-epoxy-1,2-dihydrophenyl)acetyl-CoA isomerase